MSLRAGLRRLVGGLALLLLIFVVALVWLVGSESGARLLVKVAARATSGSLVIAQVEGRLSSPLVLRGINYSDSTLTLRVDLLELTWQPRRLVSAEMQVDRLHIEGVDLRLEPSSEAQPVEEPGAALSDSLGMVLPVALNVDGFVLRSLTLRAPDSLLHVDELRFAARAAADSARIEGLELRLPGGELGLEARVDELAGRPSFAAELEIRELDTQRFLPDATFAAHLSGRWRATGHLDSVQVEGNLHAIQPPANTMELDLSAWVGEDRIEWSRLELRLAAGGLQSSGRATWRDSLAVECAAAWQALAWPGLPVTSPAGSLQVVGGPAAFALEAGLELQAEPWPASEWRIAASGDTHCLDISELEGRAGDLLLQLRGRLPLVAGGTLDLGWRLEAPTLEQLVPELRGNLQLAGGARGTLPEPAAWLIAQGDSLRTEEARLGPWELHAELAEQRRFELDLRLSLVEAANLQIEKVRLMAAGDPTDHALELACSGGSDSLRLDLIGSWQDSSWAGELVRLDGGWAGVRGHLDRPAYIRARQNGAEFEEFQWRAGDALVRLAGVWAAGEGRMDAEVQALPLAPFAPLLGPGVDLQGALSLCAEATLAAELLAAGELSLAAGRVRLPGVDRDWSIDQLLLRGEHGPKGSSAELSMVALDGEGRVEGSARLGNDLEAQVRVMLPDLAFLDGLAPGVEGLGGSFVLDLNATGPPASRQLRGRAELAEGRMDLPMLGAEYRQLTLLLEGDERGALSMHGKVESEGSQLAITAEAQLAPQPAGRLEIRGREFLAASAPGLWIKVSPDLELRLAGSRVDIGGSIAFPEGRIVPPRPPELPLPVSADVELIGVEEEEPQPPPVQVHIDLRVEMGDELYFEGFGLAAYPRGHLRISADPQNAPTGTGSLELREGRYQAFGQDLRIERGRVVFAGGALENPGLDFRAYRLAEDGVVAGFEVGGTALEPELVLYSEPTMDDADALSYVLLGHGRQGGEEEEGDADEMAAALAMLGTQGGRLLVRRVADRLGIEEAKLETDGEIEETELVLGTHLSPRLWVSYGFGLFDAVSALRVRYRLNSRWALQGETGQAQGADLLFSIER